MVIFRLLEPVFLIFTFSTNFLIPGMIEELLLAITELILPFIFIFSVKGACPFAYFVVRELVNFGVSFIIFCVYFPLGWSIVTLVIDRFVVADLMGALVVRAC